MNYAPLRTERNLPDKAFSLHETIRTFSKKVSESRLRHKRKIKKSPFKPEEVMTESLGSTPVPCLLLLQPQVEILILQSFFDVQRSKRLKAFGRISHCNKLFAQNGTTPRDLSPWFVFMRRVKHVPILCTTAMFIHL